MIRRALCSLLLTLTASLTACSGGAVVFAPTAAPPDASPARYAHPSGAFTIDVPRLWPVYEQYTTNLASASFSPPGSSGPLLTASVISLGQPIDTDTFISLIDRYQAQVRPDLGSYSEQHREALGDGSWRVTGLRLSAGGDTEQVNTFLTRQGSLFAVLDVVVPAQPELAAALQAAVNTLRLPESTALLPADLTTLASARPLPLSIVHVATWSTADGVFFITGEVANYGTETLTDVPIEAALLTPDGLSAAGAVDQVMGHGLPPGGFAPFSLRFGQGQPSLAQRFSLRLGGPDWQNAPGRTVYGADVLRWTDQSAFDAQGRLTVTGTVESSARAEVYNVRAVLTVFDSRQRVIGAAWADVAPQLVPGASADFALTVPDLGGEPVNYIVTVQATD